MESLDSLAHRFDTDKRSGHHGYTVHYERFFEAKRYEVRRVLELGVGRGASLRMWEAYFPSAQVFGVDTNPECLQYRSSRISVILADQGSSRDMEMMAAKTGGDFDVIIDDGGHYMSQQLTSFRILFPSLRSGGVYVVEDLCTSYWSTYQGGPPNTEGTMVAFLKHLVDDLNKLGVEFADHNRAVAFAKARGIALSEYAMSISSIQFFPSIAFIGRR